LSVRVLTSTDFGENIGISTFRFLSLVNGIQTNDSTHTDFSLAEAVVDATHRHSEIFYSKE